MSQVWRLNNKQVEEFFDVGFIVLPNVFAPAEVATMRAAFDRLEAIANSLEETCMHSGSQFVVEPMDAESGVASVRIHRIVWCGAAEPVLSRYGLDPRLLETSAQLLGSSEMNQLINQAHFKLPGDGVEFPWHQDSTHRRYDGSDWKDVNGRGSYIQTITAIDPVTESNGPMQFIPGSCRLGHVPLTRERCLPASLDANAAATITMDAGSVLMFGPYSFHCSGQNTSSEPRRVFINGFACPGANTRVYPGDGAGRSVGIS